MLTLNILADTHLMTGTWRVAVTENSMISTIIICMCLACHASAHLVSIGQPSRKFCDPAVVFRVACIYPHSFFDCILISKNVLFFDNI